MQPTMLQTLITCIVLSVTFGHVEATGLCITNSDCTDTNTACISGICQCREGYTVLNGQCTQVFGRACFDNLDCDDGRTICTDSKCTCKQSLWIQRNGICVSYHGSSCSKWSDCGASNSMDCKDNKCVCAPGYKHMNDSSCVKVLRSQCEDHENDTDCPLENSSCKRYRYWPDGPKWCKCNVGYTEKNDVCVKVLGSSCDHVACRNPMLYDWYYDNWEWYSQYHLHLTCDANNTCSCDHGFVEEGASCKKVIERNCTKQSDCGNYPGYSCNSNLNSCTCAENFYEYSRSWYYDEEKGNDYLYYYYYNRYNEVTLCLPVIGATCGLSRWDYNGCPVNNSKCNNDYYCECIYGFTLTSSGACEPVLGMACTRDTLCQLVDGGICGADGKCVCRDGYYQEGENCTQVLGLNCTLDTDCFLEDISCVDGTCACMSGTVEFDQKCLRQECAVQVPVLPDLYRRSVHQRSVSDEPVIDDALLNEGWYSIGRHSIYASQTAPKTGQCSTYHPIFLTETLSANQLSVMETREISVIAAIGGTEVYGMTETVALKLRKCGKDTQVYINPATTHFAALCLNNEKIPIVSKSGGMFAKVVPSLVFESRYENYRTKHIPYVMFTCLPAETVSVWTGNSRYPFTNFANREDINFYYVHWYIDDTHFKSFGPVSRQESVNHTSLSEYVILDAGYKLGFKIRCTFEITNEPYGKETLLATSQDFVTGLQNTYVTVREDEGVYLSQSLHIPDTPLGCESYEGDSNTFCNVTWPLIDGNGDLLCGDNLNQPSAANCSFSLTGMNYTYYITKTWATFEEKWSLGSNYYYSYNGTHEESRNEYFKTRIDISANSTVANFKIKVSSTHMSTGHKLWDGYKMPDINGHVIKNGTIQTTCNISQFNNPVISVDEWESEDVVADAAGEFIIYRSKTKPVEIHIQTEVCTSSLLGDICFCGITFRDGGAVYANTYCGGTARIGQIYGERNNRDLKHVVFVNGMTLTVNITKGRITDLDLSSGAETLQDGEGLCAFSAGSYRHRNGAKLSSTDGFLSSWKVQLEESLLNPKTHKTFAWSDAYMLCFCPSNATMTEITYSSTFTSWNGLVSVYESTDIFLGKFKCSSDTACQTTNKGEVWEDTLMRAAAIKSISARLEIRYSGIWPYLHLFCDFDVNDKYFYTIFWKLDDDIIYESKVMDSSTAAKFYITNDKFQTEKYLLEAGFSCGASVHDSSKAMLVDALFSEEARAIEFVETEILLPRGGDVTVQLKLNIPFVCKKKSSCHFDFKLFDASDSNSCSDSSIAIKNKNTCGQRVWGVDSDSALVNKPSIVNFTVTTKNNDKYLLRDTFTLKMGLVAHGETSKFWEQTFNKKITVFVRDDDQYWQHNYCYVNNDPRVRTFDGQYYSHFLLGEFIMMRHKKLPVEVQMETHYYGWYSCGVTVRAGRDVYTINHCHGDHITGYLLADDKILKVKERNEHRYEIYLPHGTRIDVRISSWWKYMVNVFIYPSPSDMNQVEGLCGNFDGNVYGDLVHSDGTVTYASYYYWWWWWISNTDAFLESWRIAENTGFRSLTDIEAIEETLDSWYKDDVFCVCTGNNGNGEVKCSANERETCVSPKEPPGKEVSSSVRQKRSGQVLDKEYKRRLGKLREKRAALKHLTRRSIRTRSAEAGNATVNANIESCRQTLSTSCGILTVQDNGLNVTFEELINNCGQDASVDPSTDWSSLTCEAIEANVEQELRMDVLFQESNPELVANITDSLCVGNCSGHGACVKGACVCYDGFTASDCSLDLSAAVDIEGITGDGICDVNSYDCTCIRLTTSGSLPTTTYKLVHKQLNTDGNWTETGTYVGTVVYDNFNEVFVCLEESSRKKRSISYSLYIAKQYKIALSNNGSKYSDSSKVFVLDTTCLQVDQTNSSDSVSLLSGYCIIRGVCYGNYTTSPSDSCLFCNDTENAYEWTRYSRDGCNAAEEDDGIPSYIIGIIVVIAVLVKAAVVVFAVFVVKKKLKNRVSVFHGELYDMPGKRAFTLRNEAPDNEILTTRVVEMQINHQDQTITE